jgi:tol-pal system protein YbgF
MRPHAFVLTAAALVLSSPLGPLACARSAEERQLDQMRAEIDKVQLDRDDADRSMLEPEAAESAAALAPARTPSPADPRTAPPAAVNLGPGGDRGSDDYADTEDTTPRPTLRVFGAPRGRGAWRGEDQVEQTLPDDAAGPSGAPARPSALDPEAKRAYDAALALVGSKQYTQALDALAAFLVKWPDHPYADNAMYWRGECYFARGDYLRASEQFEGVLARFPAGNKAPDALLKLGMSHQKLGNPAKAKECFDRLTQLFPQSEAARRIPPVTVTAATPSGPRSEDRR